MDHRGFTLLEVLISLAILALALPILLGLRNFDLDLHARANDVTTATLLAQEKLVETEIGPPPSLGETGGDFQNRPLGTALNTDTGTRAEKFRWKRFVNSTPIPIVREVKIQVLWPQGPTDDLVEVSTYVFAVGAPF